MKRMLASVAILSLALAASLVDAADHGEAPKLESTAGHAVLAHEVGVWDAEQKIWMEPDSPPTISKGVETNEMLGNFWVVGNFESEMFGQPFFGRSQVGYDPVNKKFVGTWIDSSSPALNMLEGKMDGDTLTMYSTTIDPETGQEKTTKMISTYPDANHKTFVAFDSVPGKKGEWRKTMEVMYTKRTDAK